MFSMEGRAKEGPGQQAAPLLCCTHYVIDFVILTTPTQLDLAQQFYRGLKQLQNFSGKKQEKEEHLGGHLAVSSLLLELSQRQNHRQNSSGCIACFFCLLGNTSLIGHACSFTSSNLVTTYRLRKKHPYIYIYLKNLTKHWARFARQLKPEN